MRASLVYADIYRMGAPGMTKKRLINILVITQCLLGILMIILVTR